MSKANPKSDTVGTGDPFHSEIDYNLLFVPNKPEIGSVDKKQVKSKQLQHHHHKHYLRHPHHHRHHSPYFKQSYSSSTECIAQALTKDSHQYLQNYPSQHNVHSSHHSGQSQEDQYQTQPHVSFTDSSVNSKSKATKDISQGSLLTAISTISDSNNQSPVTNSPNLSYPMTSTPNNSIKQMSRNPKSPTYSQQYKMTSKPTKSNHDFVKEVSPSNDNITMTSRSVVEYENRTSHQKISPDRFSLSNDFTKVYPLTKSLSSNAIMNSRTSIGEYVIRKEGNNDIGSGGGGDGCDDNIEDGSNMHNKTQTDVTDSRGLGATGVSSKSTRWDPNSVDLDASNVMLENLDEHIKNTKAKLKEAITKKDKNVSDLITGFINPSVDSIPGDSIRKNFEQKNKTTDKSLEKMHKYLEELEYRRNIIYQEGIPKDVDPKLYVKHLPTSRKAKKKAENVKESSAPVDTTATSKIKTSFVSKFLKNNTVRSASAENVSKIASSPKDNQLPSWLKKSSEKLDHRGKSSTLESSGQRSGKGGGGTSSNGGGTGSGFKKPPSGSLFSPSSNISSDTGKPTQQQSAQHGQEYKSHSNSICSIGVPPNYPSSEHCISGMSAVSGDSGKNEEIIRRIVMEEMDKRQYEYNERLRYEINTKLDSYRTEIINLRDETDVLNQQLKEINDKIDKNNADFQQKISMNSISMAANIKNLEEKLDYQLELEKRFLQDKIDSCSNNINMIDKRTEQLPAYSKYSSGRSDVKIITDHFCNLIVSLIAFIILLMSSGFHLLIKLYNFGATIVNYRHLILPPLILVTVITGAAVHYSWWDKLVTTLSYPDSPLSWWLSSGL